MAHTYSIYILEIERERAIRKKEKQFARVK